VCAFIAWRTGEAKGFFLLGIWTSLAYGGVFLLSVIVRRPLVGVIWHLVNGEGQGWRRDPRVLRGYDIASLAWVVVFGARFVVQRWLYDSVYADTWLGSGIELMSRAPAPSLAIVEVAELERYGAVRLGPRNTILGFDEKREGAGAGWINAGLYHLHASHFEDWNGESFSVERELFPRLAEAGALEGAPLGTQFIDIGVPADYFRFCRWIESGRTGPL